jgi:hypothetical protein
LNNLPKPDKLINSHKDILKYIKSLPFTYNTHKEIVAFHLRENMNSYIEDYFHENPNKVKLDDKKFYEYICKFNWNTFSILEDEYLKIAKK